MILLELPNLLLCEINKRPSLYCKSPYVADISINGDFENIPPITGLGHTPSLGCCGLCEKGCKVLVSKNENSKKCTHTVYLSILKNGDKETIVGVHPKLAEKITYQAIIKNCISNLKNVKSIESEKKFLNSRFDFYGIDETGSEFILEVKTVPLVNKFSSIYAKHKEIYEKEKDNYTEDTNIAYFPDGYRKKKDEVVSPRALKHVEELSKISAEGKIKTYLCFVIQRDDAELFQISLHDPIYRSAVKDAIANGVKIITLKIRWNREGKAEFIGDDLKIDI